MIKQFFPVVMLSAFCCLIGCATSPTSPDAHAVLDAASNGNLEVLRPLVERDTTLVRSQDQNGMTPLHLACINGHVEVAEFLLANGANVNAKAAGGLTPLHTAINGGDREEELIKLLLNHGAEVDARTDGRAGYFDRFAAILVGSQYFNPKMGQGTPLMIAAAGGRCEATALLLSRHADVNAFADDGETALLFAAEGGEIGTAKILLDAGAHEDDSVSSSGLTALHFSAQNNDISLAVLLLSHNADVNAKDIFGDTAMAWAISKSNDEVAEVIRSKGTHIPAFDIPLMHETATISADCQRFLTVRFKSKYSSLRHVIIIQEPHDDVAGQISLLHGLEAFFKDNPRLASRSVFLAEGAPAFADVSVEPLVRADSNPSDQLINYILKSYLITGYLAFDWKYHMGIPTVGTEDERLYKSCVDGMLGGLTGPASLRTYVARNDSIANVLLEYSAKAENPILFVGGAHVFGPGGNTTMLGEVGMTTVARELEKHGIGFVYFDPVGTYCMAGQSEPYKRLFRAQQAGDYDGYINSYLARGSDR